MALNQAVTKFHRKISKKVSMSKFTDKNTRDRLNNKFAKKLAAIIKTSVPTERDIEQSCGQIRTTVTKIYDKQKTTGRKKSLDMQCEIT